MILIQCYYLVSNEPFLAAQENGLVYVAEKVCIFTQQWLWRTMLVALVQCFQTFF